MAASFSDCPLLKLAIDLLQLTAIACCISNPGFVHNDTPTVAQPYRTGNVDQEHAHLWNCFVLLQAGDQQ